MLSGLSVLAEAVLIFAMAITVVLIATGAFRLADLLVEHPAFRRWVGLESSASPPSESQPELDPERPVTWEELDGDPEKEAAALRFRAQLHAHGIFDGSLMMMHPKTWDTAPRVVLCGLPVPTNVFVLSMPGTYGGVAVCSRCGEVRRVVGGPKTLFAFAERHHDCSPSDRASASVVVDATEIPSIPFARTAEETVKTDGAQ